MKTLLSLAVAALAARACAMPSVSNQSVGINQAGDRVRILYALEGEDAVVTVQFFKNGTELINETACADSLAGDVNRKVAVGARKKIEWTIPEALRGNLGDNAKFVARLKLWPTNSPPPYMVVHLTNNPVSVTYYASTNAFPLGFGNDYYKRAGLTMRRIPAAGRVFHQGSKAFTGLTGMISSGGKRRNITLSEDYYIGVYEYTYGNLNAVNGTPSCATSWPGSDDPLTKPADTRSYPVLDQSYTYFRPGGDATNTGWPAEGHAIASDNAMKIAKLRLKTGIMFDLPTEAQWWIACYGDGCVPFCNGAADGSDLATCRLKSSYRYSTGVTNYAWTAENSTMVVTGVTRYVAHPVGLKLPNSYGLYDMIGNATEWVLDGAKVNSGSGYSSYYCEADDLVVDPVGYANPSKDSSGVVYRLQMGGSYVWSGNQCSLNHRYAVPQTHCENNGDTGCVDSQKCERWCHGGRVACPATAVK